jgi:hypothetical protein
MQAASNCFLLIIKYLSIFLLKVPAKHTDMYPYQIVDPERLAASYSGYANGSATSDVGVRYGPLKRARFSPTTSPFC